MLQRTPFLFPLFLLVVSFPAFAQATRTWVSGVGDDANPCSRTAPCKTFAGAISKTAAGGEIDALDPGGFGAVTITSAITIDGGPGAGGILVSGTNAITISAAAGDVVVLRRLNLVGLGTGLDGIKFNSGGSVVVDHCHIVGFQAAGTGNGINFAPTTPPSPAARLIVKDTSVSQNLTNILVGAGNLATISNSQLFGSGVGLDVKGGSKVSLYDSVVASNSSIGIHAESPSEVNVEHGVVTNNTVGVQSEGVVRLSDVMVSDNTTGISGTVVTFGNNRLAVGNGTDGTPSSSLSQQ